MDATHFRQRAARAREMAQSGDDIRLSQMLLEVAMDLDAEAEAMEAIPIAERREFPRLRPLALYDALLHISVPDKDTMPVQIMNLSHGGAKIRADRTLPLDSHVSLEVPSHGIRVDGTVSRVCDMEAAVTFDPAASTDAALCRLLLRTERLALQERP